MVQWEGATTPYRTTKLIKGVLMKQIIEILKVIIAIVNLITKA